MRRPSWRPPTPLLQEMKLPWPLPSSISELALVPADPVPSGAATAPFGYAMVSYLPHRKSGDRESVKPASRIPVKYLTSDDPNPIRSLSNPFSNVHFVDKAVDMIIEVADGHGADVVEILEGIAAGRVEIRVSMSWFPSVGSNLKTSGLAAFMHAAAAAASNPISRVKPNSVVSPSTGGNNRSKPNTTTILPSPAPSDEPSPAQETDSSRVVYEERNARMAPVTRRGMDMQAEEPVVRSPKGEMEAMRGHQGQMNEEPQAVRSPQTVQSPMMAGQGHTPVETGGVQSRSMLQSPMMGQQMNTPTESQVVRSPSTQTVRSPSTQEPSPIIQQRNINTESQEMQSSSTQQPPPTVQQGNMPTSTEQVRFSAKRQQLPMSQRGQINYRPQAVQSPTTQQPPPTVQQGHANTAPQAVQSSPAGSVAKRRKMTSANHPNLKTMVTIIEQHVNSCGGMRALANNIERQRIRMLQEACRNDDYFYVALHQMFFLWSLDPDLVASLAMPKGGSILNASFTIIGQLIMQDSTISDVHTKFFSTFPNHLSELMYRSDQYSLTVNNVSTFLAKLSLDWQKYIPECRQRGCPPLVDELVNRFGLLSPILQHIIFTVTRRNVGFPDDEYSAQMEQLFDRDQESHRQMAARVNTAYPPTERETHERNQWQAEQYAHVRAAQLRPLEEGRRMEMAQMPSNTPHTMQPNMPTRVLSPSNMPSAAQAGRPHPFQTNLMPSEVWIASPQSATLPSHRHAWAPQVPSSHQTPSGSVPERSSRSPMPTPLVRPPQTSQNQAQIQQLYQPNQAQNVQLRQSQVNDIARTALRNASISASLMQFSGPGVAAFSPLKAGPFAAATAAPGTTNQQQQQRVSLTPLIPPVGYIPPYQFPQPDLSALYQAHLRSPVLRPIDADERLTTNQPAQKYYQAVQGFAAGPTTLKYSPLLTKLTFVVDKPVFRNIAEDKLSDPSAPLLREIRQGSFQYRVRCTRVTKGTEMDPSDFIVADTNFPPTIFMEMNDSVLDIRRKNHDGKDRPLDVTYHVYDCGSKKENLLRIFVPRPAKTANDILYSIAIEVVEVFRHQQIIEMCLNEQHVTAKVDEDDDVALVSTNVTIDLADPFTSRIFTTPVRGVRCRHRECFDLETFLVSRSSKPQEVACMPDVWKCPLCGGDASPRSLRVDGFLVAVRESLERRGELGVKAILVEGGVGC
ncbi:hypothetical protein V496_00618 [Pseudogymnoascus sp. VKM F-4515 (FW-2607)]|nr:hypothetical protein V496_00618 [Pseudogymnoascus sp. VKM F-4515 (FW-2607)]